MNDLIRPVADTFAFNTGMVSLGLSDLPTHDAIRRSQEGRGNSVAFLVGHISSSRYGLLKMIGAAHANPFAEQFGAGVGCQSGAAYPSVSELAERWSQLADKLQTALGKLSADSLLADATTSYPTPDKTVRGALAFICWHECYHLGQIGMIRTGMGYASLRSRVYEAKGEK